MCILEKSTAGEGMADSKTLRWQWAWCVEDNCGSGEVSGVLRVRVGTGCVGSWRPLFRVMWECLRDFCAED